MLKNKILLIKLRKIVKTCPKNSGIAASCNLIWARLKWSIAQATSLGLLGGKAGIAVSTLSSPPDVTSGSKRLKKRKSPSRSEVKLGLPPSISPLFDI